MCKAMGHFPALPSAQGIADHCARWVSHGGWLSLLQAGSTQRDIGMTDETAEDPAHSPSQARLTKQVLSRVHWHIYPEDVLYL